MTEALIAEYLYSNKACILPGLGTLLLEQQSAGFLNGGQALRAPSTKILFKNEAQNEDSQDLINFISKECAIGNQEANDTLNVFCRRLQNISVSDKINFVGLGEFLVNDAGDLFFQNNISSKAGFPDLEIQKVIRRDDVHAIRVGDQEETNQTMREQLQQTKSTRNLQWIIISAFILLVSIILILIHEIRNGNPHYYNFGNQNQIEIKDPPSTYQSNH